MRHGRWRCRYRNGLWWQTAARDRSTGCRSYRPWRWNRCPAQDDASPAALRRAWWWVRGSPGIPGRRERPLLLFLIGMLKQGMQGNDGKFKLEHDDNRLNRSLRERSEEAVQSFFAALGCFLEPVI